jgi:hypothetical protein
MPEGSFGPGMVKMETLLDEHKDTDRVGLKTGASERDGVSPTRKDPLNSDSRTCDTDNLDPSRRNKNKSTNRECTECHAPAERGAEIDFVGPSTTELGCKCQNPRQEV